MIKKICAIMLVLLMLALCSCTTAEKTPQTKEPSESDIESSEYVSESEEDTSGTTEETVGVVEESYTVATTLTKSSLKKSNRYKDGKTTVSWAYNGLYFVDEDCEWINNTTLNSKGTVNQGAIYRAMAFILGDYDTELYSDYSKYSKILIGSVPETMDDFLVYVENAKKFICKNDSLVSIMEALQQSDCVSGTFDYDKNQLGVYDFKITDLKGCAADLKISEEMLGYVIALLSEYTSDITFENNTCHIKYTSFEKQEADPISKIDFLAEIPVGSDKGNIFDNMVTEGYDFYYCYYDSSNDPSKDGVIKTNRGIHLGDSKKTVIDKYGESNSNTFIMQSNVVYQDLLEYSPDVAGIMRSQCSTYISYAYENLGAIEFYFDESDFLSWIVFFAY